MENLASPDSAAEAANSPIDCAAPPPQLIGTVAPVGIEKAMKDLELWFMEAKQQSINDQLRFLAIVGFGGLGKTTLAMALYRTFGDEFDCRASVLASQKFHLPAVLRSLIKEFHDQQASAPKNDIEGIEEWDLEHLKKQLANQLEEKRCCKGSRPIYSMSYFTLLTKTQFYKSSFILVFAVQDNKNVSN